MKFVNHKLANGLDIVAECNGDAWSTALGFFVKTGARDETDDVSGVSHFLEHMAFKGTPTRSAEDVNRQFDEMGGHSNAYTSEENTVYHAVVLPEYQDQAVELLADILRPSLRETDFETEKQVILEEIRMYEDQPPFGAEDRCRALYYGDHPLGRSVLGTEASITALGVDAMREYFERRYCPSNITLVGCGRVDFDSLVKVAERFCGSWQPRSEGRLSPPVVPRQGFHVIAKATATQQYAVAVSPGPSATDPGRYAAQLLATIIGDDGSSRFYWPLIETGLAETATLSHHEYEGAGVFWTYLVCEPEQTAENLQIIRDILRQAEAEGVTAAEVATAKSKVSSRVVLSGERPRMRLFAVGSDWVYRREYRSTRDDLEAVAALSLDDVLAVQSKFALDGGTTVTIGPLADVPAPR